MPAPRKPTDIRVRSVRIHLLPVEMRMPLKFGPESVTAVTCIRVAATVENERREVATGWGETPLSVTWAWPSAEMTYAERYDAMTEFCDRLGNAWAKGEVIGHPIEIGDAFLRQTMPDMLASFNAGRSGPPMPHLAALIAASAFDLAVHDAYGVLHAIDIYDTYHAQFMSRDLASYLTPEPGSGVSFEGKFPADFLDRDPPSRLPVWHLVGGLDPLDEPDRSGAEPDDGYPVTLREWIARDGLTCLKVKLRGNDADWDYQRLVDVGSMALGSGVLDLSADFNCTVHDPQYVNAILDRWQRDHPRIFERLLYVEQPFPYDLEAHRIDVRSVSDRKPLFLDESAHDWRFVALGKSLGWSGVALKTCKTQTGALLSLCWAKAHGMPLMVQDLTNPMLAQIPHVRLAARAGTIRGVESNGMQFYPEASRPEAAIHPGVYRRRGGELDLATIRGPGFGYRVDEIRRELPPGQTFESGD